MPTKLLIVDGSNIVMRAAFGGDVSPENTTPIATGLINRAARQVGATHMVIALDSPAPSWRKQEFPEYKAHRTVDTQPWFKDAHKHWMKLKWYVEDCAGYEADDIIATLAKRTCKTWPVVALSNDSDLLSLTALGVEVLRPMNGGTFVTLTEKDVCAKYDIPSADRLTHFKALTGETNDNIPGVPGIGPKRAAALLQEYGSIEEILAETIKSRDALLVAKHADAARLALRLVSLSFDAPLPPIAPRDCILLPF